MLTIVSMLSVQNVFYRPKVGLPTMHPALIWYDEVYFCVMPHKWPIPHRITRHRHNYTKSVVHTQSQDTIQYSTFGRETAVLKRATLTVFSLKECVVWVSRVESRGWLSAGRPMLH
jgi:ligand-binding SRPBCC domain-containing protein